MNFFETTIGVIAIDTKCAYRIESCEDVVRAEAGMMGLTPVSVPTTIDNSQLCRKDGENTKFLYNNARDTTKALFGVRIDEEHRAIIINSFPLYMMSVGVQVTSCRLEFLKSEVSRYGYVSLWGHSNSVQAVSELIGVDMTPTSNAMLTKPEDNESLCYYEGKRVEIVFIIAPVYQRRGGGVELSASEIEKFEILRIVRNYPG